MLEKKYIVVVAQKDGAIENPTNDDIYKFGTLATVMKIFDMPDKSKSAIVQGLMRVKLEEVNQELPYFTGLVSRVKDIDEAKSEINNDIKMLKSSFTSIVDAAPYLNEDQMSALSNIKNPSKIADKAISLLNIKTKEKQEVLEITRVPKRVKKVNDIINKELQRIELGEKIQSEVQDEISKSKILKEELKIQVIKDFR
jgi:ATP-dependent Lon protease